jgi:MscS family membrane protein
LIIYQIDLKTSSQKLQELIDGVKKILSSKDVESFTVLLESISGNAFLINGDYFTAPITQEEFNDIKERINLSVLKLMESMDIRIAGANKEIRIISGEKS